LASLAVVSAIVGIGLAGPVAAEAAPKLSIDVLSNRADLVSGGNALIAVGISGVNPAAVQVTDDGRDVTSAFALRPNGRFEGVVDGLGVGRNVLAARAPGATPAQVTVTNHPSGGPVFSGPQVQPWVCQEGALDEQCNAPASYEYRYKSSLTGQFAAYDPASPPSDVATTTTDQGVQVPYIVRVETGYQDRDQYKIAVLWDPAQPWTAWSPQKQWNHKLLITHGASCGIDHQTGSAPDVVNDDALSRGFAVMSTALNNAGHNCNLVTQAESMVMAKEHLVEQYGELRYTIGTGCSGGSLTQQQVANAYPGIYQGILPACSFPDAWSTGQQLAAYNLLRRYLEDPTKWAPGVAWTPLEIAAVEGHPNHVNSIVFDTVYWTSLGVPDDGCPGVPAEQNYNAQSNPGGVRCTLADYMINVLGPRPSARWIQAEKAVGHGFAGIPLDNVGVQFGLEALEKGQITPAQFVDLNEKVGGTTVDIEPTVERFQADQPALRNAYLSGAINSANNLDRVAIIDLRGPDPGAFHDAYRSWAIRARLEREQGHYRNHVIWMGHVPLLGDPRYVTQGLVAMDRWLAGVEQDGSTRPLADKIVRNRPADIQDRCSQIPEVEQIAVPGIGQVCKLQHVETRYGTPATVAGESIATDTNKCTLKPHRRFDYYPIEFSDQEWARLQTAFPTGVCDWTRPGVNQRDSLGWRSYQDAAGRVVYGGRSLGAAPGGSGQGWTSPAFSSWRSGL
jgi:hypothetical protein